MIKLNYFIILIRGRAQDMSSLNKRVLKTTNIKMDIIPINQNQMLTDQNFRP